MVLQVAQNVDKHQFNTFVKSKGLDPDVLSDTEKLELRKDMMSELYPGKTSPYFKEPDCIILNVSGLDKVPQFLRETMLPNIAPETAAQASVTINGGYVPCQHDMVNII